LFVIPLQIKRVGVKNGLATLRHKQLAKGILSLFMSGITVVVLSLRFFLEGDNARYLTVILVLLFCTAWFIEQVIESSIYHTQFTLDQILLHEKIARAEKRQRDKLTS
jgi:uncharacterized membrane protein